MPNGNSPMNPESLPELARLTALKPLVPMVYVAWADGDLTDEEIENICSMASQFEWLDRDVYKVLSDWLDPEAPPSPRELKQLLSSIRRHRDNLSAGGQLSLVDLGIEIARLERDDAESDDWPDERIVEALKQMQTALGLEGYDLAHQLFTPDRERPKAPVEESAPAFDVGKATEYLDGNYSDIKNQIRDLLATESFQYPGDVSTSEYRQQVYRWLQILADEGFGRLAYPESAGGRADMGAFIASFESLAMFDQSLVVKFGVQFGLFGGSIQFLGTDDHRKKYLERVGNLELPGGFAMTEKGHGSNVRNLETIARYQPDSDSFIISTPSESAQKEYIGNAAVHGQMMTVFAQLCVGGQEYGVHPFLVPIRDDNGRSLPGVQIRDSGHKMGLNGVDNGTLAFDDVEIPGENMLDRYGSVTEDGEYTSPIPSDTKRFFTMLGTLVGGRVSVASASVTAMKSGLAIATRYGTRRRQFGPPGEPEKSVLDYRSHKRKLIPRIAEAYALSFATGHLRDRYLERTEQDKREVEALAAGLKAHASWRAVDAVQTAREACGGEGYMTKNRIAQLRKDIDIYTTFEGDNTVLMLLVARSLLDDFRKQFEDEQFFSVVSYLAKQAEIAVRQLNPIATRNTSVEHLVSADFQSEALAYRKQNLVRSSAQRIRQRIDDGASPFEAFGDVQDHLLSLANAYIESVVFEQFERAVEECENDNFKGWLETLRRLYGLELIHRDVGWFLESGYIEPPKSKAIRTQINRLCDELRPQAIHLVDAFGIPRECLDAEIAFSS